MNILEISNEEETAVKEAETTVNEKTPDLETLLSDYTEPAKVEQAPAQPNQAVNMQPPQPQVNNGAPHWYGNPLYYQRGKKKGTLRPNGAKPFYQQPVNMSVNPGPSEISGDIITGALFLTIINLLVPMFFSVVNNMVSKRKVAYEDLQIDDKTLKQLDELANKALKHVKIEANPVAVLIVTMIGLYALQFMTVKMLSDVKPKITPNNGHKLDELNRQR